MARAQSKNVGISPQKVRLVLDLVRGKRVDEAADILRYMTTPAAEVVLKTIESAAANAENSDLQSRDALRVTSITADGGRPLRRFRPKARGRVGAFDRPTSHITVVVDEDGSR
jgi:large subunit ribosomal protein L22